MKFTKTDVYDALREMGFNDSDIDDLFRYKFSIHDLKKGMNIELEHGKINQLTNISNDDKVITLKIALAHLLEDHEYYKKLSEIEGGSIVQSIIFNKKYYNKDKSGRYLFKHNIKPLKIHETNNYYRYRLFEPRNDAQYYTIKLKNGVSLVIMK